MCILYSLSSLWKTSVIQAFKFRKRFFYNLWHSINWGRFDCFHRSCLNRKQAELLIPPTLDIFTYIFKKAHLLLVSIVYNTLMSRYDSVLHKEKEKWYSLFTALINLKMYTLRIWSSYCPQQKWKKRNDIIHFNLSLKAWPCLFL